MSNLLSANANRSYVVSNPTQQPPKENPINIFELTLLLKLMGFRLNSLDYVDPTAAENWPATTGAHATETTIEIKCGLRSIVSRLSASGDQCSCPAKREDQEDHCNFWEVHGTAPSASPGKKTVEDTSSSLLPRLSKRGVDNTKQLLGLIFEGFNKDHLPTTTTTGNDSPEQRPGIPLNPLLTSTQVKSPRPPMATLNRDMLLGDVMVGVEEGVSPKPLMAPPNTPKVGTAPGLGFVSYGRQPAEHLKSARNRDHLVYVEVVAAKERLERALLTMKMNIAGDFGLFHGDAMNLSTAKIFEEEKESPPGQFKRRSSLGSFPNLKSKADGEAKKRSPMVRNKSSIDAGAAQKAKTAVTSRYLLPKKAATNAAAAARTVSPATRKTVGQKGKRSPTAGGLSSWK